MNFEVIHFASALHVHSIFQVSDALSDLTNCNLNRADYSMSTISQEIGQLKTLQADLNAAFETCFCTAKKEPGNAAAIAASRKQIADLAQSTLDAALGPVTSIIRLAFLVCYLTIKLLLDDRTD